MSKLNYTKGKYIIDGETDIPLLSNLLNKVIKISKYEIRNFDNVYGNYAVLTINKKEYITYSNVIMQQLERGILNGVLRQRPSPNGYNYLILEK